MTSMPMVCMRPAGRSAPAELRSPAASRRRVSPARRQAWAVGMLPWVVVCFLLAPSSGAASREMGGLREAGAHGTFVRITCDSPAALKSWHRFISRCQSEVDRALGYEAHSERLVHIYFGREDRDWNGPFRLVFRPDDSMLVVTTGVIRALLLRECVGADGSVPPPIPSCAWLSAAICNRVLYGRPLPDGRTQPDYEPARFLFARNQFPDVLRLLTQPVTIDEPVLYRLYAVHCDLLALCVQEQTPPGSLLRLLQLEKAGRSTAEALKFLLRDACRPGENLQAWYERTVVRVSRRGRRLNDAETITERLRKLISVQVVAPGETDFRGRRVPIDEVPKTFDTLVLDKGALARMQAQLYELYKDAPELMRSAISAYMKACGLLAKGKKRAAKRQFERAHRAFGQAVARQEKLDAYLDDLERTYVPPGVRLGLYLDIARKRLLDARSLDTKLQEYLDSLDKGTCP